MLYNYVKVTTSKYSVCIRINFQKFNWKFVSLRWVFFMILMCYTIYCLSFLSQFSHIPGKDTIVLCMAFFKCSVVQILICFHKVINWFKREKICTTEKGIHVRWIMSSFTLFYFNGCWARMFENWFEIIAINF